MSPYLCNDKNYREREEEERDEKRRRSYSSSSSSDSDSIVGLPSFFTLSQDN